jgi:hypothetical protein
MKSPEVTSPCLEADISATAVDSEKAAQNSTGGSSRPEARGGANLLEEALDQNSRSVAVLLPVELVML